MSERGGPWCGLNVVVTGHTGFKGGWLSIWLSELGARVHGLALEPPTTPAFFKIADVSSCLASDRRGDVRDLSLVVDTLRDTRPKVIFHLAAQPLVRDSYQDPVGAIGTNVMGTVNLLEAVRSTPSVAAVVIVTSDKVYENREWDHPYRESDRHGGRDPYSASKAACEIVTASLRVSFFGAGSHNARIATARSGNVIGGGDFSTDRLVPDCLRAFAYGEPVRLRFPGAIRPWQHVLEPLRGYISLAEHLLGGGGPDYARSWNFGPNPADEAPVGVLAERMAAIWGDGAGVEVDLSAAHPHEAGVLRLDSTLARLRLGWRPRLDINKALTRTVAWHRDLADGADMSRITRTQIAEYMDKQG